MAVDIDCCSDHIALTALTWKAKARAPVHAPMHTFALISCTRSAVWTLQGSGFETNTSASNIIDRWTREACAIIVRHNNRNGTDLPMPELPARAYCAGMASSCYVLKAVDVEMLMLPGVLKDDLRYPDHIGSPSGCLPILGALMSGYMPTESWP